MGVQTIDTIGIVNFIIYVPLTLLVCFILLRINLIYTYLKIIVKFADEYILYFVTLLITIFLLIISIILYSISNNKIQKAYLLGKRMQDECKNIYSIVDTSNYQLKLVLDDPNGPSNMIHIASIIMYIAIITTFLSISLDNISKKNDDYKLYIKGILSVYPLVGVIFIIFECIKIYKTILIPQYLVETYKIPLNVFIGYTFVFVGFMIQYYLYNNKMQPYSFILIIISLIALILIYFTQNNKLKESINKDYKKLTEIIKTDITDIGKIDSPNSNFLTYKDLPPQPKTAFTIYLMENIKADPKWKNRTPDDDTQLWPYVLNEANGKELENMYLNATDAQKTNIQKFRKDMSNLRLLNTPSTNLSKLSFIIYILVLVIIALLIYPLFNLMYINNPLLVTYIVSIGLVIILCIFCIVSFISKILP